MRDPIGRTLGHHPIVDKTGEGGMGEVYQVKDTSMSFAANPVDRA